MRTQPRIKPSYYADQFIGFSCWLPRSKELSNAADYKSLVLMNRRALRDLDARPIERSFRNK